MDNPTLDQMSPEGLAVLSFLVNEVDARIRSKTLYQADRERIRAWMNVRREELRDKK